MENLYALTPELFEQLRSEMSSAPLPSPEMPEDDLSDFSDLVATTKTPTVSRTEFAEIRIAPSTAKLGRRRIYASHAMSAAERKVRERAPANAARLQNIAVLDFETEPFDNEEKTRVFPFLAILYSNNFSPVIIWDEDEQAFIGKVIAAIEALPDEYTIYAHNGGKFDYMFLIHRLRGRVSFKGRGIMSAKIGNHELRDSFHLIPEKLAAYQKDAFNYDLMKKAKRGNYRQLIIDYCLNDCKYLLDIILTFINQFGLKISIGQAAMAEMKKHYKVKQLGAQQDAYLRNYFFGGRVECLAGKGHFVGDYKLYDVNSMYPAVMATMRHPIGNQYTVRRGKPTANTFFVELRCDNAGALVSRTENNETTAELKSGRFLTTIHEYRVALKYKLISNVKILHCIDCEESTTFENFILPLYDKRQTTKKILKTLARDLQTETAQYMEVKKDDIFWKLLLNNSYGKLAQNPRRFKESYLTDSDGVPPKEETGYGLLPRFKCDEYAIWERPSPAQRFNNVGTAASITGGARSVLLEAIQNAVDPIYCDTDSLICRGLLNTELHPETLGAWDLEAEFDEVIIAGKKLYACKVKGKPSGHKDEYKVRSKGTSGSVIVRDEHGILKPRKKPGLQWDDMKRLINDEVLEIVQTGCTLTKQGGQFYMTRKIRATAPAKRKAPNANTQRLRSKERLRA